MILPDLHSLMRWLAPNVRAADRQKTKRFVSLGGDYDALKSAALQSHTLLSALVRHEQTVYAQASQSAACMAAHHVEARLCRWLLRARDLANNDTLDFTQEFLAEMRISLG